MVNRALRVLYIYNGVFTFAGSLFGPLYALYIQQIGASVFLISASWGLFLISSTLFTFVVAKFGDRVREREYFLMAGYLVRAFVWAAYIFVPNFAVLIVLQIILGLGEALGSPAFDALMAEHVDRGRHMEEYADMKIIFNLGAGLAAILGGAVVSRFGFPALFVIMAALALISFFGILAKPRRLL